MSQPAARLIIRGLKCDAEGCDFLDPDAPADETSLNRICPKCGANLLTEADLANVFLLKYVMHSISAENPPAPDDAKFYMLSFHMDGTGKLEAELKDADCP